jgi:hypothetical protein
VHLTVINIYTDDAGIGTRKWCFLDLFHRF